MDEQISDLQQATQQTAINTDGPGISGGPDCTRVSTLLERMEDDYKRTMERASNLRRAIDILKNNPVVEEFSDICTRVQRY